MRLRRGPIVAALIVLACIQGFLQHRFITDFWAKNYSRGTGIVHGLAGDQLIAALAGFRPLIAGILWVRANSFFESGNYDAILPMVRLVTWLDPQQIDVYATGMWHIGYNFTDDGGRSDRRYIPSALALGKEGARNNPETYEMFFETGWMWYHKIDDDYAEAVQWFELGNADLPERAAGVRKLGRSWLDTAERLEDIVRTAQNKALLANDSIPARRNMLGMAYQRNGQVDKGLEHYLKLYDLAVADLRKDPVYGSRQQVETLEQNIDTLLVRMAQRGWFAQKGGYYDEGQYDPKPPFDVGFSVRVTVESPKVLVFEGTWNVLPVGTRIRAILRDKEYKANVNGKEVDITVPGGLLWDYKEDVALDPPKERTFMQDQLYVRNRRFNRKVDMSKDPTMYPFTSDEYVLEFFYSPRSAPPHIQDKLSWNGEGMTDANFLNTEIRPGQRVIFARLELTRDQILRRGVWYDQVPVVQTKNFRPLGPTQQQNEIIEIPSLRMGK